MDRAEPARPDQQEQWDSQFSRSDAFFGEQPSEFARISLELFRQNGVRSLLEVGCGQGRDTVLFAGQALAVTALDYSEAAVAGVRKKAADAGLLAQLHPCRHDVREALPFADEQFDACYSHMLLCMELSTAEIAFVLREMHRVLKPGGLAVYSVRSNFDRHYRAGTHWGEDIYEIGGFAVQFFTAEKIRRLSRGYELLQVNRMEEGSLPRDLFCVTMRKGAAPQTWDLPPCDEDTICAPLERCKGAPEPPPGRT